MPMRMTRRVLFGSALASFISLPGRTRAAGTRIITAQKASLRLLPGTRGRDRGLRLRRTGAWAFASLENGETSNSVSPINWTSPLTFACQGLRMDNAMEGVAGLTQAAGRARPILRLSDRCAATPGFFLLSFACGAAGLRSASPRPLRRFDRRRSRAASQPTATLSSFSPIGSSTIARRFPPVPLGLLSASVGRNKV